MTEKVHPPVPAVKLFVPTAAGVPLPANSTLWLPGPENTPVFEKVIPLTVFVVIVYAPGTVTLTSISIVLPVPLNAVPVK